LLLLGQEGQQIRIVLPCRQQSRILTKGSPHLRHNPDAAPPQPGYGQASVPPRPAVFLALKGKSGQKPAKLVIDEAFAMNSYEYRVVPAPNRAEKFRGAKTTTDRFALTLAAVMNELGRDGWEYLRADTLPCEERTGFTGRSTSYQTLLVFRRVLGAAAPAGPHPAPAVEPRPLELRPVEPPRIAAAEPSGAPRLGPATD
jgi:hypothetical protein